MDRRNVLKNISLGAGALAVGGLTTSLTTPNTDLKMSPLKLKGNINHSACRWCYSGIELEELAEKSADIGLKGLDLLTPNEWAIAIKYGLECSLGTDKFANIIHGFNEPKNHKELQEKYTGLIDKAADAGVKQVIVFSGNRHGMDDAVGLENCAVGLEALVKQGEKRGVTLVMELLNSKVNHKDYMCDTSPWGVQLVEKIGSENFGLLYDIYHMQIMEGDVISTIRKYNKYYSHYHTGGVPGRNEINDSQELNYPAIMKAIVATGFKGYVAQEFIPTYDDKIAALREGITICDV
ncbi:hydroxypyruvate isomerase family protein [Urechidicola vernalis]|uniref:TIM barrel protein n=1 Tax=Urechidicola vernalis TaxID=3075600 RepID=A0ABU2Y5X3_9FLAO|nr:TIM barrel protein [Urechidicola sp. P050]MDT0553082.1 TIM barrel protein [Urechidicola sp. P050]